MIQINEIKEQFSANNSKKVSTRVSSRIKFLIAIMIGMCALNPNPANLAFLMLSIVFLYLLMENQ